MNLLSSLFVRQRQSSQVAKDRLQQLLARDRAGISAAELQRLRQEMISTLAKHVEIDIERAQFELRQEGRDVLLAAQFPLRR
ncbi:MAG: cell division topological specificity factor MinE [Chloroflexi bacterium]|nr:cell division topological specificity factor MinE [Chloroflexota bacterium]